MAEAVERYQTGKEISLWIDPDNVQESVIARELKPFTYMGLFFSIPFLTVGICGLGWAFCGGQINNRSVRLREIAAQRADQVGSHHLANRLRDTQSKNNEKLLFLA